MGGAPARGEFGDGEGQATRSSARPGQSRARCGQEDSGARSEALASLKPGWAWGQGALLLGVAGPRGAGRGGGAVLTAGQERSACGRAWSAVPTSGWGWDSGGLGRGAGRRGQLLPLMSQGHE